MPDSSIYDKWQSPGVNNQWVLRLASFFCNLLPGWMVLDWADATSDWYGRFRPETLSAIERNLSLAFPQKGRDEIALLAEATMNNYIRSFADFLSAGRRPISMDVGEGEGILSIKEAAAKIIVTAHMGNWEMGGFYLGEKIGPHWVVTYPEKDPGVDRIRDARRIEHGILTMRAGAGIAGLMRLRKMIEGGGSLVFLVERAVGRDGAEVVFRGRRTRFLKSPALLSELTGAPLVPVAVMAEGPGRYRACAGAPICAKEVGMGQSLQELADFFGEVLEQYPDQWYNFFPYWEER